MTTTRQLFTASEIAIASRLSRTAVHRSLRNVTPSATQIVAGNETKVYELHALPASLRAGITDAAQRQGCRDASALLQASATGWPPKDFPPLANIDPLEIAKADKLRSALAMPLQRRNDVDVRTADFEQLGTDEYKKVFGFTISARHWQRLLRRTIERAGSAADFGRLELYLPDSPKVKATPAPIGAGSREFPRLAHFVNSIPDPAAPSNYQKEALWKLALQEYAARTAAGEPEKTAARSLREFLVHQAPFLVVGGREAMRKAFDRRRQQWAENGCELKAIRDGRRTNGDKVELPAEDIDRLRHSTAVKNGGRMDAAWREEYTKLTEKTRLRYPPSRRMPRAVCELVNRELTNALTIRHRGQRYLRSTLGSVERDWAAVPSLHRFSVDDLTANLEVFLRKGGKPYLFVPQVIAVMDSASRKYVGFAVSNDKGPTAELVCEAVLDAFRNVGVCKELWLENGFTFGKALSINGKVDEAGRTVVAGLAHYGCIVNHHEPGNPRAKGELEKSFDLLQRQMERHPGYTGREQRWDAPDDFKREQSLINRGKAAPEDYRYEFSESGFVNVLREMFATHNDTPNYGKCLNGLTPNQAFELRLDPTDKPIVFTPEIQWLLANARYLVTVKAGGVAFTHYGEKLRVRGGRLADPALIGTELWAFVDRQDDSTVTFMRPDFTSPFTLNVCEKVGASERSLICNSGGRLSTERSKIKAHERAVTDEYHRLLDTLGNPRRDLLADARSRSAAVSAPDRTPMIDPDLQQSAEAMAAQRDALKAERKTASRSRRQAAEYKKRTGQTVPDPDTFARDEDARALEAFLNPQQ